MKKIFFYKFVIIGLLTGVFFSCSKEITNNPEMTVPNTNDSMKTFRSESNLGGVAGSINPVGTKAYIMLYGRSFTSGPHYVNAAGSYKISNLPSGEYKFVIFWINPNGGLSDTTDYYSTKSFLVIIEAGVITNMEPINL